MDGGWIRMELIGNYLGQYVVDLLWPVPKKTSRMGGGKEQEKEGGWCLRRARCTMGMERGECAFCELGGDKL